MDGYNTFLLAIYFVLNHNNGLAGKKTGKMLSICRNEIGKSDKIAIKRLTLSIVFYFPPRIK